MMKKLVLMLVLTLLMSILVGCGGSTAAQLIDPNSYVNRFQDGGEAHLLVDVRTPEEYASGHIAGSVNIPLQILESQLSQIPQDMPVVIYCRSGNRSAQAMDILKARGYSNLYDMGGIISWQNAGYPIQ